MGSSVALSPLKANSSLSMGFHIELATRQWQPCLLNLLLQPAWLPLAHELASRQAVPVGSWGGGCPLSGGDTEVPRQQVPARFTRLTPASVWRSRAAVAHGESHGAGFFLMLLPWVSTITGASQRLSHTFSLQKRYNLRKAFLSFSLVPC